MSNTFKCIRCGRPARVFDIRKSDGLCDSCDSGPELAAAPAGGAEPVAWGALFDPVYAALKDKDCLGASLALERVLSALSAPTAQPQPVGLSPLQEPKYTVNGHAIVNRASGEEIPTDEPVFIFRARDKWAAGALGDYATFVEDPTHKAAVEERFIQFGEWAEAHPERMKEPDTHPERLPYVSALDPVMQEIKAQSEPAKAIDLDAAMCGYGCIKNGEYKLASMRSNAVMTDGQLHPLYAFSDAEIERLHIAAQPEAPAEPGEEPPMIYAMGLCASASKPVVPPAEPMAAIHGIETEADDEEAILDQIDELHRHMTKVGRTNGGMVGRLWSLALYRFAFAAGQSAPVAPQPAELTDAARYRWLRNGRGVNWDVLPVDKGTDLADWRCMFHSPYGMRDETEDSLDAAIDAAILAQGGSR